MIGKFRAAALALAVLTPPAASAELPPSPFKDAYIEGAAYLRTVMPPGEGTRLEGAALYLLGNIAATLFHDFGHALKSELQLPIVAAHESAADSFAHVVMVARVDDPALDLMVRTVAESYFIDGRLRETDPLADNALGAHAMSDHRAHAVICMLVGSDPLLFKASADRAAMTPEVRAACKAEYADSLAAWGYLLQPHLLGDTDEGGGAFTIAYDPPQPGFEAIAKFLQASGIVEAAAGELQGMIRLPHDLNLRIANCGKAEASWQPRTRTIVFCYETALAYSQTAMDLTEATLATSAP
ncbi:hypothetical protein sos41_34750 [Alphaproteobacteria bacterium SO-S41]|nr:hypothetical protein sos41_34750 [Alphaproteobacteria bacterium SO-S41]